MTAPRRFGKSTNLNMIKKFLEIEVDEFGNKITQTYYARDSIRDTYNYNLFIKHGLKITHNMKIMRQHFGKHPVIHLHFNDGIPNYSFEKLINLFQDVLHESFRQHRYLLHSRRLNYTEKRLLNTWCCPKSYKDLEENDVAQGLKLLSIWLYRHFGKKKVYFLIDEFDKIMICTFIYYSVYKKYSKEKLFDFIEFSQDVMSGLLNNTLLGGFITGTSYTANAVVFDLNIIKSYRFLDRHQFVEFYGLTRQEVSNLIKNTVFNLDPVIIKQALLTYNCYVSVDNLDIYNIWSILHFLKTKDIGYYWDETGYIPNLKNTLKIEIIRKQIESLLLNKTIDIEAGSRGSVSDDFIELMNIIIKCKSKNGYVNYDLYFSYLLDSGYLTYTDVRQVRSPSSVMSILRITNKETKQEFLDGLNEFCHYDREFIEYIQWKIHKTL